MSRAHAVAPSGGAEAPYRGYEHRVERTAPRVARRALKPSSSFYTERALLLWPRLDRAKLRRFEDDPARIAELVERRTSQPYDVILAMLTRQSPPPPVLAATAPECDRGRAEVQWVGLRIVRNDPVDAAMLKDLLPA